MGSMSPDRAKQRIAEMKARYNEEVFIDDRSGEVTVNGIPKFSFTKTYFFPSVNGSQTDVSEMGVEGYDMQDTQMLKYFFDRFVLDTKIPANRFPKNLNNGTNPLVGDAAITREEYAFSRFIERLRAMFKEVLLKPTWIQVCLKMPEIAGSEYFKSYLGLNYFQENTFTLAKERQNAQDGAGVVSTLSGLKYDDGSSVFSTRWLVKKYLGLTDNDLDLNAEYLHGDQMRNVKKKKKGGAQQEGGDIGGGRFGGDEDLGGGFGGGEEIGGSEPIPEETINGENGGEF